MNRTALTLVLVTLASSAIAQDGTGQNYEPINSGSQPVIFQPFQPAPQPVHVQPERHPLA